MPTLSVSMISAALLSAALLCGAPAVMAAQTAAQPAPAPVEAGHATPAATTPAAATPAQVPAPTQGTPAADPAHAAPVPAAPAGETPPAAADGSQPAAAPSAGQPAVEAPAHAQPQPAAHGAAAPAHGAEAQHGEAAEHAESPWGLIARIFNFIVLVGALVYFLRAPLAGYLSSRSAQIRNDLVTAKNTTVAATAQLAEIDAKLKALPAELQTLKKRGAEEIAAEEARIKQTAEAERHRLLEQTRKEIELQVRLAKRDLNEYAATLAVDLATDRIKQTVTETDQQRLIDRYVTQVRSAHE